MKAIRIHRFGAGEDVLEYEEVPEPSPAPGELLIKIEAAALNRADLGLRRGTYRVAAGDLPIIPGREFAGRVEALGAGVAGFEIGARVVAYPGKGGYAEYGVTQAALARPLPDGIDPAAAASVPTVCLTAWFALLEDGALKTGEQVLIQAGSSGVGHVAVQIANILGAAGVFTTAGGARKCARLRELGADEAIDYTRSDFRQEVLKHTSGRGVDVALEMLGGDVYTKSLEVLAAGGRLVSIGGAIGPIPEKPPELSEGRKATRFSITNYLNAHPEEFKRLDTFFDIVRQHKLRIVVDRTFPLAEARAAQRYLEGRDHFGKVVLVMS
ncbi:MAG TPA: zinc-binding dehydrogenase [Verrucomicrobiae bacterium]|jgi:NADPH2:quinone reductase|nr:zinc-binding dehydrogenase [Verrucomicrobiae bacterium]